MEHKKTNFRCIKVAKCRFRKLGENIKKKIEYEIKAHKKGAGKVGTVVQLQKIIYEVEQMICKKYSNNFAPTYPKVIIDSWDHDSKLGLDLLKFYELYNEIYYD